MIQSNMSNTSIRRLRRILNERADGNRNIMHIAVWASSPKSNKNIHAGSKISNNNNNQSGYTLIELKLFYLKID